MKKTYEKPALRTEIFDEQDVVTASGLTNGKTNWETDQFSSETLNEYGIRIG